MFTMFPPTGMGGRSAGAPGSGARKNVNVVNIGNTGAEPLTLRAGVPLDGLHVDDVAPVLVLRPRFHLLLFD
jgi:hypothetical protein